MAWIPDYLKAMAAYLQNPNVQGMYGMWDSPQPGLTPSGQVQPGEGGVDLDAAPGTPVYALATGPVVAAGYWNDQQHGVVTQRVNVPGVGPEDIYYQHIYLSQGIHPGQQVQRGQQIGTVGNLNETEIGFNSLWGGIWGTNHPGPWVRDPRPWIAALMTGDPPAVTGDGSSGTPDWATQFHREGIKIGLFLVALVLVGFGFYLAFEKQANALAKGTAKLAVKAALL